MIKNTHVWFVQLDVSVLPTHSVYPQPARFGVVVATVEWNAFMSVKFSNRKFLIELSGWYSTAEWIMVEVQL